MSRTNLFALLMTLLVAGAVGLWAWHGLKSPPLPTRASIVTTPAGWRLFTVGSFTFYAPKDTHVRQAQRPGLVYGDILGPGTCLHYSVGRGAGIVADARSHADYSERPLMIEGRQARVRTAELNETEQAEWFSDCPGPYYIGLIVPNALPDGSAVALEGTASSEDERDQVEIVFKSVRFVPAQ